MSCRGLSRQPFQRAEANTSEAVRNRRLAELPTHRPESHLDDSRLAPAHLDARPAWASRSHLTPFVRLARTLKAHRDGILAALRLGLSNGRLEGLNSKIRLISHRSSASTPPTP
jgi:transposase